MNALLRSMRTSRVPCFIAVLVAASFTATAQDVALAVNARGSANYEVLTTGPIHEGFARPVVYSGVPVAYVHQTPPALIEEVVPLERPEGATWVGGYWSFDDQANKWIWVSGTWRVPPPGYSWVPGYWYRSSSGWRYVDGYWAPTDTAADAEYLPEPPAPLEVAAVDAAPYEDAIYVPGNWMWSGSDYAWRNSYWVHGQQDWTYVPASYTWSPYGYRFVDGYWDRALDRRGLLYAPVSFAQGSYLNSGFSYTPAYVVNSGLLADSLFVRPAYDQYYFGDYYAPNYWGMGYYPAYAFHSTSYGYDPLFAYSSWRYGRGDTSWLEQRRAHFRTLQQDAAARPARTIEEQARRPVLKPGASEGETAALVVPAKEASKVTSLSVQAMPEAERQQFTTQARTARTERIKLETKAEGGGMPKEPRKVNGTAMMVNAGAAAKATAGVPQKPELPKVDANANAKTRTPNAEAIKNAAPSLDRAVDHMGRVNGKAPTKTDVNAPGKTDGARPEPPKPTPERGNLPQPTPEPKRPEVAPTPQPKPLPPVNEPPKRPEVQPTPERGKLPPPTPEPKRPEAAPAPQPKPLPPVNEPKRPDGVTPIPERGKLPPPTPEPKRPEVAPTPQPKPLPPVNEPPRRPEVAPKPIPQPAPQGKPVPQPAPQPHPQPAPQPQGHPQPQPEPHPQPAPKPDGKPDGKPGGKPDGKEGNGNE